MGQRRIHNNTSTDMGGTRMKKTIALIILISLTEIFCFGEKWYKTPNTNSWGEEVGTCYGIVVQPISTSIKGKDCNKVLIAYIESKEGIGVFSFSACFSYIAPVVYNGYIEVKNGPKIGAIVKHSENMLNFEIVAFTPEQYRKSYQGKLIQLRWDNDEYITIKAPIWEE